MLVLYLLLVPIFGLMSATGQRVCYNPYGCFDTSDPWDGAFMSTLPRSPNQIRTTFKIYNADKTNGVNLKPETSDLRKGDKVVVLVHGLSLGGHDNSMYGSLRPKLLKRRNARNQRYLNVITVDWAGGVDNNILQSVGNARLVAAQLAYLIKELKRRRKLFCKHVHIIGFSMGASIAGLAGKHLKQVPCRLQRITGLDPVKHGFELAFGSMSNKGKLHRSDARYVDVIHTYTRYRNPVGNADFYPNGGFKQPGCQETGVQGELQSCYHFRAVELFASTILPNSEISCEAVQCETYATFTSGGCRNRPKLKMGFESSRRRTPGRPKGKFYLKTTGSDPFCGKSVSTK